MRSDSATAVETAVIPVISPETVTPDAEAWQAVVRHLIVFRPVRGRGHPRTGRKNGIKLNATALPTLDC
jgi:hypothetical protein